MSEYQYYEFQAVEHRLSEEETQQLRAYSARAHITPTSFINEYNWGSFKGDPSAWMEKYFDGFLYLANWGTRELQLALPAKALPVEVALQYCSGQAASVREKSGKLIFAFSLEEEPSGEWLEGDGILSSLLPIRSELARGDFRALYLGWLLSAAVGELDDSDPEPPLPPNLGRLSTAQASFADFFCLDSHLLAAAAQNSPRADVQLVKQEEVSAWVASLPSREKEEILIRLIAGEGAGVGMELQSKFQRRRDTTKAAALPKPRTVAEILVAAETRRTESQQARARKAALEKEQQERAADAAREKYLDSLKGQTGKIWSTVKSLTATRQPKNYDLAVKHVVDLRDLAERERRQADFREQLAMFRQEHAAKGSLIGRLSMPGYKFSADRRSHREQTQRTEKKAKAVENFRRFEKRAPLFLTACAQRTFCSPIR